MRFDERVLVLGLTDIDGIGDKTAISIAKVAATNGFENLTIDDITEVRGISTSIAEEVLIYLRGFYHGHQKHASM